jgi:UDP-glucose 4-epimerase
VTGGAGYIGSVAVALLIERGYQVTVLDDISTGHTESIPVGARLINGSILDQDTVLKALEDCTAVLHFAGKSLVGESIEKPDLYQNVNVNGTSNLLVQMRNRKIKKLIFSSSAAIYGDVDEVPITEDSKTNPKNSYGSTKLLIEELISEECALHGLSAVSLRYFNVVGALKTQSGWLSERHDPETHLIPNVLKSTEENPVRVFGTDWPTYDGTCIRDYVHVIDLVEAHLLALLSLGDPGNKIYNLGSGIGYSVKEVIGASDKATGRTAPFVEAEKRSGDPAILIADITKVKRELGWAPIRGINEMVADAFGSMKDASKKNLLTTAKIPNFHPQTLILYLSLLRLTD